MKRRDFIAGSALVAGAAVTGQATAAVRPAPSGKQVYELRVHHFKSNAQKNMLDQYYTQALIPLLNRHEGKVGAFEEYGMTEPPTTYSLLAYPSLADYHRVRKAMWSDEEFKKSSSGFFRDTAKDGAYLRYESYLLEAFDAIPQMRMPDAGRGLFELRIYESNNEEAGQRKIKMFNKEELALFDEVGLHAVFFGEIMAGPQMPALVYMLWFKDMDERTANWKAFSGSPKWKEMSGKEEYANTVSVVNRKFLVPSKYSQI